jgi:hypothetical protein
MNFAVSAKFESVWRPATAATTALAVALMIFALPRAFAEPPAGTDADLSFFQTVGGKTQWMIWSALTNRTETFMTLPAAPSFVIWDAKPGTVLFVNGDGIFQARRADAAAESAKVAVLPRGRGEVRAIWRDKRNGLLRVATMQRIAKSDILKEKGQLKYRLPDGTKIAGMAEPDWGTPFACSVLELQADGVTWKLIATRATKDEAGDTPGLSVVDDLRSEAGLSSDRVAESYTCANHQCRNDVPKNLVALASRLAKRKLAQDELSLWRTGPGLRSILFGTIFGDELHMAPPVIILSDDEKSGVSLPVGKLDQLALGVEAGLLLVSEEGTGAHPVVVDLRTGQVRFNAPAATSAMWVPKGF